MYPNQSGYGYGQQQAGYGYPQQPGYGQQSMYGSQMQQGKCPRFLSLHTSFYPFQLTVQATHSNSMAATLQETGTATRCSSTVSTPRWSNNSVSRFSWHMTGTGLVVLKCTSSQPCARDSSSSWAWGHRPWTTSCIWCTCSTQTETVESATLSSEICSTTSVGRETDKNKDSTCLNLPSAFSLI